MELGQETLAAAQSSAPLVLIHTLAIDEAGHRQGPFAPAYRAAARASDELLGSLLAVRRPEWTLLALADHGHAVGGGHGDIEEEVRFVTACLAGPGIPVGAAAEAVMPDLTAVLAERLGVERPPACAGRSLRALLAGAPRPALPGDARPHPALLGLLLAAAALLGTALALLAGDARRRGAALPLLLPLGPALSLLLLLLGYGPPSLSRAYVYPAFSPVLLALGLPAALLSGLQLWSLERLGVGRRTALPTLALGCLAPTLVAAIASGWPLRRPPLAPYASGWASSLMVLSAVTLLGLGAWMVGLPRRRRD